MPITGVVTPKDKTKSNPLARQKKDIPMLSHRLKMPKLLKWKHRPWAMNEFSKLQQEFEKVN